MFILASMLHVQRHSSQLFRCRKIIYANAAYRKEVDFVGKDNINTTFKSSETR